MSIAESLLAELEQESEATRRILERIPEDKLNWAPAEKSMTIGQLGLHIANGPGQVAQMAKEDTVSPPDFNTANPQPASRREILEAFAHSLDAAKSIVSEMDDARMTATWRVVIDGREIMALPRAGMLRMIMLNHQYHHRGQLSVYLRLLGESVPSVYGPTADEMPDFLMQTAS